MAWHGVAWRGVAWHHRIATCLKSKISVLTGRRCNYGVVKGTRYGVASSTWYTE